MHDARPIPQGVAVKRLIVLTSLSLTAVFMVPPMATSQSSPVRATPTQVTSSTTPKRDRTRPYTFTTKGRIVLPGKLCAPGAAATSVAGGCIPVSCPQGVRDARYCTRPALSTICSGKVNIRFQKRGRTISSRNVSVRPDCSYKGRTTFRSRARSQRGVLRVRARFQGNRILKPKTSTTKSVRAG